MNLNFIDILSYSGQKGDRVHLQEITIKAKKSKTRASTTNS
jgi:hypothetical protein